MTIQEINRNTPEGRLLITAIGLIAADLRTDKSASDILNILEKKHRAIDFVDVELNHIKEVKVLVKVLKTNTLPRLRVGDKIILHKYDPCRKMYVVNTDKGCIWIHESNFEVIYRIDDTDKKFEVGAMAKIIGKTNNHKFKIGEKVTLVSFHDDEVWKCQGLNDHWWVEESDLELI